MKPPIFKFPAGSVCMVTMLLLFVFSIARTQHPTDSLGNYVVSSIEVKSLRGYWYTDDSLGKPVEFIDTSWYEITLDMKDGYHPYYFVKDKQDSTRVSSSGCFPHWPPFDCDLLLVNDETLELRLSEIGGMTTTTLRCKRRK